MKYKLLIILGLLTFCLSSCKYFAEDITISFIEQKTLYGDNYTKIMMRKGISCIEYDSVRFSDDSYAVYYLQNAPQNSLTEFFDNKGRTMATVAQASECYAQTLVYNYDDKGRLVNLVDYKIDKFEGLDCDSISFRQTGEGYLKFRQMINDLDYEHPDTAMYRQINIEYDEEGNAVKAYQVYGKESIVAPNGYKLNISVEPCTSFWASDINGGFYIFHVKMEPKSRKMPKYQVSRYVDFLPTMKADYQNGRIVKNVWFPNPSIVNNSENMVFIPVQSGDINLYTYSWVDNCKRQMAFRNGFLAYKQEISKYGTILNKVTYSFLPNNKMKIEKEVIDYKTKKLKPESVSVCDVGDKELYSEELYIVNEGSEWENYYALYLAD